MKGFTKVLVSSLGAYHAISAQDDGSTADSSSGNSTTTLDLQDARKISHTKNMLAALMTAWNGGDAKSYLTNYGCFCYPQGEKTVSSQFGYHGAALDELDQLCRDLWIAQKCLPIDAADGQFGSKDICGPDNGFKWHVDINGELQCGSNGQINYADNQLCKAANCQLESEFVTKVAELLNNGYAKNQVWNKMDEAAYKTHCAKNPSAAPADPNKNKCCGVGLARRSFDPDLKECCEDNGVETKASPFGSC